MSRREQASEKPPPRWVLKLFTRTRVLLNGVTGGLAFNRLGGREVCFVTTTGAKSDRRITIPLMYAPYEDGLPLVASPGDASRNPVWYGNIARRPDIDVRHRGRRRALHARLAAPQKKARLWPTCDAHCPPYADYRARSTRDIPVFVCEPRG